LILLIELQPTVTCRKAGKAQNDSTEEFFRGLWSPLPVTPGISVPSEKSGEINIGNLDIFTEI
jgi:hypothetical protein